jgi:hypothetical protein
MLTDRQINGLRLIKSLVKLGTVWHGDIVSLPPRWIDYIVYPDEDIARIFRALEAFDHTENPNLVAPCDI